MHKQIEWIWEPMSAKYVGYSKTPYALFSIKYEDGLWRLIASDETDRDAISVSMLLESFDACTTFAELVLDQIADVSKILRKQSEDA